MRDHGEKSQRQLSSLPVKLAEFLRPRSVWNQKKKKKKIKLEHKVEYNQLKLILQKLKKLQEI